MKLCAAANVFAATSLILLTQIASGAALTPGDILFTTSRFYSPHNTVWEYTQAGALVQSWNVPFPGLDPTAGDLRGVTVSPDGKTIYTYNGTSPAYITAITPATNTFTQYQALNLATANVTYLGSVTTNGKYVFATSTFTRFNASDFTYTQPTLTGFPEKVQIGADGLLYVKNGDENLGSPGVQVYDPETMTLIRHFAFATGSAGVTGDALGNIYNISGNTVYEYSPTGSLINSLTTANSLIDISMGPNNQIILGAGGAVILTNTSLSLAATKYLALPSGASGANTFVAFVTSPVPEPASLATLGGGLLLLVRRRRTKG